MDRRTFLRTLAGGLLGAPLAAEAQPAGKIWKIGFLGGSRSNVGFTEAFEQGLRELGYVDGQNIAIEYRFAEGKDERLPLLAAELVDLKVDVLVAPLTQGTLAAKHATKTIPIVMVNVAGPVESGFVGSLARPGGNVTGLSRLTPELIGKNLELLKEAVPQADRVAALANPTNPLYPVMVRHAKHAAGSLGVALRVVEAGRKVGRSGGVGRRVREAPRRVRGAVRGAAEDDRGAPPGGDGGGPRARLQRAAQGL